jgi:hypothetical protein
MKHSSLVLVLLAAAMPLLIVGQAPRGSTPVVVTKFLGLFDQLRAAEAAKTRGAAKHVTFRLNEGEINEYLKYSLKATPRPGLDSVTLKIFPNNYVSTFTVVDFDAVERWKPGTIPALLRPVLNGRKSIWVDYRFHAEDFRITFSVEKAYYDNIRLPAFFVQKMISIVAARQPEKYDTSKPLPVPFGLKRVQTAEHAVNGET